VELITRDFCVLGFGSSGQKKGFSNPFLEDRKASQDGREFAPSSVTFEWLRQV